jgi:hypothetical protein
MPTLLELQLQLRGAVLGEVTPGFVAEIETDRFPAEARLRIYRNHLVTTLSAALQSTYPVVCRLERDPVRLKHIRHWRGNWRILVE